MWWLGGFKIFLNLVGCLIFLLLQPLQKGRITSASMKKNIDSFASGDLSYEFWIQKYRDALGSSELAKRLEKVTR